MHRIIAIACHLTVALTAFICAIATAGAQEIERAPKVQADLISRVTHILPGQPFEIGLRQIIEPKWHTYWKNPGDSGEPTRISWELPDGFSASDIAWPIPEAIPVGPLTNYGYSDQVILPVTITPPAALPAGPVTLTATATWLVCEKICIPESAKLSLTLPVSTDKTTAPSEFEQIFDMAQRSRPIAIDWPVSAQFGSDLRLDVDAPDLSTERITKVEFFPAEWGFIDHAAPQPLEWRRQGGFTLKLKPGELVADHINKNIEGILVVTENIGEGTARNGFNLTAQIQAAAPVIGTTEQETAAVDGISGITIWHAIVFAILGGIILNAMPCVLPILSLKIMSLAQHSGADAHRGGIAYLAGVMASFAILAAILILLRSLGASLGWGFQFQSPAFVLAMIALFFALGLSMSGVFDIGGSVVGFGEKLTRRSGLSGSFFTGMLATIAATPCTAPYMGAAIGYAFVRSDIETFVVLMALGLGFAAPIVLLSFADAARRMLPKPGPWMETLKQALAFPLYATVAWLAWVLSQQSGSDGVLAIGIVLTGVALAAWIIGRPMAELRIRLGLAATILIGTGLLLPGLLRAPPDIPPSNSTAVDMDGAERFSLDAVEQHRRDGRPVFVNLTAAWCISCKVNERVALSTDGFRAALHTHNIVYLKGDWTNRNDEIAAVLRSFGRAGVPLYLLYPPDTTKQPLVLPQILTEATVIQYFASLSGTTSGPQSTGE